MIFVGGPYHGRDVLVADGQQIYAHLATGTRYHRQVPFLNTADERWRAEVFLHESIMDAADAAQAMEVLKDAVLRWWITSTGQKVDAEAEPPQPLYVARCQTCELDMPFSDVVKRATWAREHNEATSHRITLREELRQ